MKTASWRSRIEHASTASRPSSAMSTAKPRWRSIASITSWLTGLSSATRTRPRAARALRRVGSAGASAARCRASASASVSSSARAAHRLGQAAVDATSPRVAGGRRPRSASPAGRPRSERRERIARRELARRSSRASGRRAATSVVGHAARAPPPTASQRLRAVRGVVADGDAAAQVRAHDLAVGGVVVDDEDALASGSAGARAAARALGVDGTASATANAERAAVARRRTRP